MSYYGRVQKYAKRAAPIYKAVDKRRRVYYPAVKQLASDVMYLKGLINSEPKYHSTAYNNNVSYNGVCLSFNDIPTGDNSDNRDGERILPRYFGVHARLQTGTAFAAVHLAVRVIIFRWWGESPNAVGVNPVPADVLGITGSQNAPDSFLNADVVGPKGDRQRRIEVLKNYYRILDVNGDSHLCINDNIELNAGNKKEHIQYYNSATNPPTSGGIYMLIITDSATATDLAYHVVGKLTFYDN